MPFTGYAVRRFSRTRMACPVATQRPDRRLIAVSSSSYARCLFRLHRKDWAENISYDAISAAAASK
jgi:hypothetical protein